MKPWLAELRTSLLAVAALAVILCGFYPGVVWILAHGLFPARADGSLVIRDGEIMGSSLIAQKIHRSRVFPFPALGGGGRLGRRPVRGEQPRAALEEPVGDRATARRRLSGRKRPPRRHARPGRRRDGLGERPRSAHHREERPAPGPARGPGARAYGGRTSARSSTTRTEGRSLGILGEPRVNVLALNLALDGSLDEGR